MFAHHLKLPFSITQAAFNISSYLRQPIVVGIGKTVESVFKCRQYQHHTLYILRINYQNDPQVQTTYFDILNEVHDHLLLKSRSLNWA